MKGKKAPIYFGTSNVVIPGNKTTFPTAFQHKSRLNYYSSLFNSVEINSTFYKLPMFSTFEKWAADVPEDFKFTLKLSKEITHCKNLNADLSLVEKFMKAAAGIGKKKGCLLIQFPGKITLEYFEKVESILQKLQEEDPQNEWKKAVEFRHSSWYVGEGIELLDEFDMSLVLHDIPRSKNIVANKKAAFVYIRFHGEDGDYRGSYTNEHLKEKALQLAAYIKNGKEVFAYFNNTIGSAFGNATYLKQLFLSSIDRGGIIPQF